MTLLGTRRAADELSRALEDDGSGAALSTGTASFVALGERLRATGTELEDVTVPREAFRAALRTRLVAVATVQPAGAPAAPSPPRGRLGARGSRTVGVAAGALASVVAVSGVAVASSQALPGDPFYGVKRTVEDLQLSVAGDGADQGDRHLQFAATRLDEVRELALGRDADPSAAGVRAAADADWGRVRVTLADMDDDTRKGSALLEQVWREDGDSGALTTLSDFASRQAAELRQLLPVMAPEARVDAEASLGLVSAVSATTFALLGRASCSETCEPGTAPGGSDGGCDCAGSSESPRTSPSPSVPAAGSPTPEPGDTSPSLVRPPSDSTSDSTSTSSPAPASSPPPSPPSLLPEPSPLPTKLPTLSPSPSPPTSIAPPSLDPGSDDLVRDSPLDLLPG